MYVEAFAQKLKKARENTGFTQKEVANWLFGTRGGKNLET